MSAPVACSRSAILRRPRGSGLRSCRVAVVPLPGCHTPFLKEMESTYMCARISNHTYSNKLHNRNTSVHYIRVSLLHKSSQDFTQRSGKDKTRPTPQGRSTGGCTPITHRQDTPSLHLLSSIYRYQQKREYSKVEYHCTRKCWEKCNVRLIQMERL